MTELHSISGLFYESFGVIPWGGYFILGTDEGDDRIEGKIVDINNASEIEGTMNQHELKFRRTYYGKFGQVFDYKFSLKNGVWVGEYASKGRDYSGRAVCKTNLCLRSLNFRQVDMRTPEGFERALVKMMEREDAELFTEPETGKDTIIPQSDYMIRHPLD